MDRQEVVYHLIVRVWCVVRCVVWGKKKKGKRVEIEGREMRKEEKRSNRKEKKEGKEARR
jgi:hypothetical protein